MRALSPKEIADVENDCARKILYDNEADARKAVRHRMAGDDGAPFLRVYRCPWCAGWHLTHTRDG